MSSDKRVRGFISSLGEGGKLFILLPLLLLGVALIFFSRGTDTAEKSTSEELISLCSEIEGVGECRAMITTDADGRVVSAAILCEGADSVKVRAQITEVISELFGIGNNRITVLKLAK